MLARSLDIPNSTIESALASIVNERAAVAVEFTGWILQSTSARRIMDGTFRVKYENNAGNPAACLQAAHIESTPSKPATPAKP